MILEQKTSPVHTREPDIKFAWASSGKKLQSKVKESWVYSRKPKKVTQTEFDKQLELYCYLGSPLK